jgi:hypothetical protein
MKSLSLWMLFRLYKKAIEYQQYARDAREKPCGILVDRDEYALEYQRAYRIGEKLDKIITARLLHIKEGIR